MRLERSSILGNTPMTTLRFLAKDFLFFLFFFFVRLLFRSHFCTLLICIHLYTHHWIEH